MENFKHSYKPEKPAQIVAFSVHNIGFQLCEGSYSWSGVRNHFLIHHIISGKGIYQTENQSFSLEKGDTFLIYPNTKISYTADSENPWEYYWLGFSGSDAVSLLNFTDFSPKNPVLRSDFGENLKKSILSIYNARGTDRASLVKMVGLSYIFLSEIIKISNKKAKNISLDYALQAREYIENNYSHKFGADDVAKRLLISRSHLYRIFMDAFKTPPNQFINQLRCEKACNFLENSSLSIADIANSVGFENQFYFSRVFKKYKGQTPSDFKAKANQPNHL